MYLREREKKDYVNLYTNKIWANKNDTSHVVKEQNKDKFFEFCDIYKV